MESKQIDANKTLNEPSNENLESIMKKYFIPPQTTNYMKWGQSFMIVILFTTARHSGLRLNILDYG